MVAEDALAEPFVVADLPGLIEGAALGAGLGIQFLKHIERCRVLVHLVDLAGQPGLDEDEDAADPVTDLETVEIELEAFDPDLLDRPRLIVGSKLDAAQPPHGPVRSERLRAAAEKRGLPYLEISSATGAGIPELIRTLRRWLDREDPEARQERFDEDEEVGAGEEKVEETVP